MPGLSTIGEETEPTSGLTTSTDNLTTTEQSPHTGMETQMQLAVRACQTGEVDTLRYLLNGHVSADELDGEGCGLMHWAAINSKSEIIKLLLSHHANIDIIGGTMKATPLHWACYNAQLAAIVTLATNGANPSIKNLNGETPLHVAAQTGNSQVIAYLMVKFDHVKDSRDHLGRSALMLASRASFGMFPTRIFTKCDAYLDFTDDETGETALHIAMSRQNFKGAVELICAGANDEVKNRAGQTPYDLVDKQMEKSIRQYVQTQVIREHGTMWEKITSRWFFIQFFTATITGILLALGIGVFYLTDFWVLLVAMILSVGVLVYFGRKKRMDELGLLPVTYICWMGMAELGLLIFDTEGFIHWSILMILCTIWVISATFYWVLILTDPGVLERSTNPFPKFLKNVEEKQVDRYCFTCWIPRTQSSHHCAQCDKCVDGFDHHCPWIHKCVYRHNLRFFVLFCFTNFLFDVLYVPVLLYMVIVSCQRSGFQSTIDEHGILVMSLGISIFHAMGAAAITYTQFSQISRHVTTIETIRKARAQHNASGSQISSPETYNPWDNRPSMKTRVQNVWNLLAFDKFGDEDEASELSLATSELSTTLPKI